jgi:hypothetical protein
MTVKKCKECGTEISSKAKNCPQCGVDQRNFFMKHKIISGVLALVVLVIIGSIAGDDSKNATVSRNKNNNESNVLTAKIGDVINTEDCETIILSAEERTSVGSDIFQEKPAGGGKYIAVIWQYKNITDKPISSFSVPELHLVDSNNVEYDTDIGASSAFATEMSIDTKIISDINPGITIKDVDVFEVSEEQYVKGGWKLKVSSNGKEVFVGLN